MAATPERDISTLDITRRAAVGALAAAGLGFALFGPRGRREPDGRVVLNYWEKWTGQEGDAMRAVVDEFNAGQDRIYVRYFSMSLIEQKAMISIAAGDPPDLVGLGSWDVPIFAETDALLPIGDRLAAAGLGPSHYAAPVRNLASYRGQVWGVPNTCSTIALYLNRAIMKEVGLDPNRAPRTIAELDEYNERMMKFSGGGGGGGRIERAGFLHREPGWWNWPFGFYFGGRLYDDDSETALAGSSENIRGYQWVQSYPEKYGPDRLTVFQSAFVNMYNSEQQGFISGKLGMVMHGPFLVNVIRVFKPDLDYFAAPFPVEDSVYDADRPIGMLESDVLAIPRGTPHPDEAFEFLAYTQRRDVVERLAIAHCKPSPLAQTSDTFAARHPNRSIEVHNRLAQSERAFLVPRTRIWPYYKREFDTEIASMWDLKSPAATVLPQIERRTQAELDRVAAKRAQREALAASQDGGL